MRRGLLHVPAYRAPTVPVTQLQVLSVGRLIEKKATQQLDIYAHQARGMPFHATIVGEGPLYDELKAKIDALGLEAQVTLAGKLQYAQVEALYAQSNLIFTGVVSTSGDRDGFPNDWRGDGALAADFYHECLRNHRGRAARHPRHSD